MNRHFKNNFIKMHFIFKYVSLLELNIKCNKNILIFYTSLPIK